MCDARGRRSDKLAEFRLQLSAHSPLVLLPSLAQDLVIEMSPVLQKAQSDESTTSHGHQCIHIKARQARLTTLDCVARWIEPRILLRWHSDPAKTQQPPPFPMLAATSFASVAATVQQVPASTWSASCSLAPCRQYAWVWLARRSPQASPAPQLYRSSWGPASGSFSALLGTTGTR